MSNVIVIGGGAAGMMAAIQASSRGHAVTLIEKNEKLGKKLYITGKGRCNLTNDTDTESLLQSVCTNRKFLYSAFYGFTSQDVIAFFEQSGLQTKRERGNRVFPVSDHSSDVIAALARRLRSGGVRILLNQEVREITTEDGKTQNEENTGNQTQRVKGVLLTSGKFLPADGVIVATGGISYASTGSTGDGYRFARELGHDVTECSPSLVPMETAENWAVQMQGLSLKNVSVRILDGKKELYHELGEMMFTHFGVTGPLILTASTVIQKRLKAHPLTLEINLKPALSEEQLDARFLREFEAARNKQLKNVLGALYPAKMIPVILERAGISGEKPVHDIAREERRSLVELTRHFTLTITGLRGYNEAIITRGGVNVRQVDPGTMESRLVKGLYFAGEVLDLDAVTGGYNLQIAWSTGYAAGNAVCQSK